jgi:adenylate cyclase
MSDVAITRRLAAILAADVAGYSAMMGADEAGTIAALRQIWSETFNPAVAARHGRIVKMMGDGALVEFGSVVDAVECAIAVQRAMGERNLAGGRPIQFRIGINLGDIVIEGDDIFGDGVNVAARLEGQAPHGGVLVSDVVHAQVNGKVGVTFSDAGEIELKNIARPVHAWRWDGNRTAPAAGRATGADRSPAAEKPSIAVLPFSAMSSDPEQEFFADGLVEDILTTLSKLSGLSVIARNSSFVYKGRAVDVRQVARELGVRYVLEGSIRKAGNRIRITAQLIDATTGAHIWADRFDRSVDDIFAVQDEITMTLATEMQVRLTEGEHARLRYTTTTNVEAWNLWVQGLNHYRSGVVSRETNVEVRRYWEKALALDPDSASLNAMIGFMLFADARFGWSNDRQATIARAEAHIEKALSIDPENSDAYRSLSGVLLLKSRFDEAVEAARKAVKLGPNLPDVLIFASYVLTCAGHPDEGIVLSERAMTLSPTYPANYLGQLGNTYRIAGRGDDALKAFQAYRARSPGYGLADMAMVHAQAGRMEEARGMVKELMAARPSFTIASWLDTQFRNDVEQLKIDADSLRAAGVPEG